MAWEPMTPEEARMLIASLQPVGVMSVSQWARLTEAVLVNEGAPREQIKAAVEAVLGHPVD